MFKNSEKYIFFFALLTFPGVAYQPHSSMTVSAAFVADHVDRWLRRVCRVGRLLLPLLPLYSFMHRSILLSSFHSCLYDCSPVPTIICGCLPCRSVDSRHFHVTFACISVAEIRTAYYMLPVTSSPYNMSFGMHPLAILWTWPSHRKRRWLSSVYMLKLEARSSTSVLVILSRQEMSRMRLRHRRWKLFNFFSCLV